MKVLMLWSYYPGYLSYFYDNNPFVSALSFEEHRSVLLDDHFGWPADLSRHMKRKGINTEFIVPNDKILQTKWAKENGFYDYASDKWDKNIALAQIKKFKPDVLWIGAMFDYYGDFLHQALAYCGNVITWISCPTPDNLNVTGFSTLVTSHSDFLKDKHHLFEKVVIAKPGFDANILDGLGPVEKRYDVVFTGSVSPQHTKRAELLAYLVNKGVNVKSFSHLSGKQPTRNYFNWLRQAIGGVIRNGKYSKVSNTLTSRNVELMNFKKNIEIIKTINDKPLFGMDMYRKLASASIALNVHIDIAGNHSGNMRMFEATGVGTCLATEYSNNITELFEPEHEVLTYKSKEELLEIIQEMLGNEQKIAKIAHAGQLRTLESHNMEGMFNDIKPALEI